MLLRRRIPFDVSSGRMMESDRPRRYRSVGARAIRTSASVHTVRSYVLISYRSRHRKKKNNAGFLKKTPKVFDPPPPPECRHKSMAGFVTSGSGWVGPSARAHTKGGGKTPLRAGAVSPGPLKILTIQFPETVGSRRHFDALTRLSTVGRNLADIFNPDHGYPPIRVLSMDTTRVMRNAQPGEKKPKKYVSARLHGAVRHLPVSQNLPPLPLRCVLVVGGRKLVRIVLAAQRRSSK